MKDVGALLDWQPDLDAARMMVQGVSHGGYMALSCAPQKKHFEYLAVLFTGSVILVPEVPDETENAFARLLRNSEIQLENS
jgi:dienelactone hydrolase